MPARKKTASSRTSAPASADHATRGGADELHQLAGGQHPPMTTNQGVPLADNQNSLRPSPRGPTLLEDFVLREKITHFDHERIPERVVHARGSAAHGHFELTRSLAKYTTAKILTEVGKQTPVFTRFSTVAGGAGSIDTPRDARGMAVKIYTSEGNWDLVGINFPVFFVQDAMKFPDLVHAVKMEPDRGYPQAASAHDTFWDFVSQMPESLHAVTWLMSDRGIPRSLRMLEGFMVHSFRLLAADGTSTFVKFHWRPKLGVQSTVWDETVEISGADPDFHRRDLFEAIQRGAFPEWELAVQLFSQEQADRFPFDHLDATKLIPEELVPLTVIGRMVLDRWPDNFFAETEQVAYCPSHLVPGIDFSNDPLLQGRVFSYLDTQLSRLGTPNFHQLPVNAPKCPFANLQRDAHMQMQSPSGRVSYEPNTLSDDNPRETAQGFTPAAEASASGSKGRIRAESFADHYSQARRFYRSQTKPEQAHIASAFVFELSKVETAHVRASMVGHLRLVDEALAGRVAAGLALSPLPPVPPARVAPVDLPLSPALQTIGKMKDTLEGRVVGVLVDDGSDAATVKVLRKAIESAGAAIKVVAPKVGGVVLSDGRRLAADGQLAGTPSVFFDAVAIVLDAAAAQRLATDAAAREFVGAAFEHLKAIAADAGAQVLLKAGGVKKDPGVLAVDDVKAFVAAAKTRQWAREPKVRMLP